MTDQPPKEITISIKIVYDKTGNSELEFQGGPTCTPDDVFNAMKMVTNQLVKVAPYYPDPIVRENISAMALGAAHMIQGCEAMIFKQRQGQMNRQKEFGS